jgi:hypothetical protein
MLRAYEGYFEGGRFFSSDQITDLSGRLRAFLTILEEPAWRDETARRLYTLDMFFSAIETCDEKVPEFEKIKFREDDI